MRSKPRVFDSEFLHRKSDISFCLQPCALCHRGRVCQSIPAVFWPQFRLWRRQLGRCMRGAGDRVQAARWRRSVGTWRRKSATISRRLYRRAITTLSFPLLSASEVSEGSPSGLSVIVPQLRERVLSEHVATVLEADRRLHPVWQSRSSLCGCLAQADHGQFALTKKCCCPPTLRSWLPLRDQPINFILKKT
jgi:hypothetical protein